MVVYWLVIIGGLNWGLVGLGDFASSNWNIVTLLLGSWPQVESLVYVLVGLSAVWMLVKKMGMSSSSDSM